MLRCLLICYKDCVGAHQNMRGRHGVYFSADYRWFYRDQFLNAKAVDDQEIWSVDDGCLTKLGETAELDVKARYADLSSASINFNVAFHLPHSTLHLTKM
jgi:iron complex outermembrane recepter protein